MTKILKAKPIVDITIKKLQTKCEQFRGNKSPPKLVVLLVGDNPASLVYVKNKEGLCRKIGISFELVHLNADIDEAEFLTHVNRLNADCEVTGFFVQLPVPSQLQHLDITDLIDPNKDVDGFHIETVSSLYRKKLTGFIPCTPKGIIKLLDFYQVEVATKHIVIIGRSFIVGKPLSLLLSAMDATVTLCHSKTKNLKSHTQSADIVISAIGSPCFIDSTYLRDDKSQILIDVGISEYNNTIAGDFNYNEVKDFVHGITPVPGGVGPMTVLSLMENIILAYELQNKK